MQQIDPTTLLVDHNVRRDTTPDKALVESVRDLGVLVPLVAVRTDAGVQVRYGHRRTRAAVQVGLDTVPVWVFDASNAGTDVDRIVRQWAENRAPGEPDRRRPARRRQLAERQPAEAAVGPGIAARAGLRPQALDAGPALSLLDLARHQRKDTLVKQAAPHLQRRWGAALTELR